MNPYSLESATINRQTVYILKRKNLVPKKRKYKSTDYKFSYIYFKQNHYAIDSQNRK